MFNNTIEDILVLSQYNQSIIGNDIFHRDKVFNYRLLQCLTKIKPYIKMIGSSQKENPEFRESYHDRKLDICGVCQKQYNVGDRIPRILVNCGHTYCTSCLTNYYRNQRIRCPFCKKLVKHLDNVETLPLNIPIFSEIVRNDEKISTYIDPNSKDSFTVRCEHHPEKQKHFFCSFHNQKV